MEMNIATWLGGLGLDQYVQAFEDNHIDAQTLPELTPGDLVALGVKSVGHRRLLTDAIEALSREPTPSTAARGEQAEQRLLTVQYCQMAGSHEGLDPELLRVRVQQFHRSCSQLVGEYDGHVANFYGDCMLVYFGWPRAHEDDAERAVRAGLALVARAQGDATAARVGIATGPVVVGDLIHEGPAQQQSAVGVTPNLAARLLGLASAGQVVIDELTRQLVGSGFATQSLGRHALKGITEPVLAHAVAGERAADSRFDARREGDVAPMIGRDHELALLQDRWAQARGGEGQAMLLVGEAGIGKSRIVRALLNASADLPHGLVRWQCSTYHADSALWPVIQRLGRAAGLHPQDSTDAALDKLEALTKGSRDALALYAAMLGLDGSQRYGTLDMTPQMLRERTLELLLQWLFEWAEQQPLLLIVEDAHWIDPTTLELIGRCLGKIDNAAMLIVVTSRPENQPSLAAHPSVTQLSLARLGRASVEAIVAHLGGQRLQANTLASIAAQSDGVPLFVEELTKAVLETGEAVIPVSLRSSLTARLDRFPEVKEVVQIAACIGREFDQALLLAVAEQQQSTAEALERLAAAGLVFRRGDRATPRYAFKHALVQEAAYESLLRGPRQAIHARILGVLEAQAGTPGVVLAHHAERARQVDKAIGYWSDAGNAALAQSAYAEAVACLRHAIDLVRHQPEGAARGQQESRLQLRLAYAYRASEGDGASDARSAYERACELLQADADAEWDRFTAQYGLWIGHITRGELQSALRLGAQALLAATHGSSPEALLCAHRFVGLAHQLLGNLELARQNYEQAIGLLHLSDRGRLRSDFGVDQAIACLSGLALVRSIQGFPDHGNTLMAQARDLGAGQTQAHARAYMHLYRSLRGVFLRDPAAAAVDIEALEGLATKHGLVLYGNLARCLRGWWIVLAEGPSAEAVASYELGLAGLTALGARLHLPMFTAGLALALAIDGRHEEASEAMERAFEEYRRSGPGWYEAELWRLGGEVALRAPRHDRKEAAHCFGQAQATARMRGARLWELRAAVGLVRVATDQEERRHALQGLATIHDSFTEGSGTVDLMDAKLLLRELGDPGLAAAREDPG